MARDSSPLSKRLKALAVRAGLPVESGQSNGSASPAPNATPAPAADDEQPTGEFPAVAAADTPADDRPTGEFPAVRETDADSPADESTPLPATDPAESATTDPSSATSGAVPPPPRDIDPAPVSEPPRPTVPPIWTDTPAESQSRLTASPTDGPTLAPPTLTSLEKPSDSEPADAPAPSAAASEPADQTPEPATELHEVAPAAEPEPGADAPHARAAALGAALSLEPEPAAEPEDAADLSAPDADEQATIAADPVNTDVSPALEPPTAPTTDHPDDAPTDADAAQTDADGAPTDADAAQTDEPAAPTDDEPAATDKLSLTGRIAAIRRRIRPETPTTPASDTPAEASGTSDVPPPTPVTVIEPTPDATAPAHDETFAKPSFSERAALRRRVKTLRARRDAGLLEIGAITIDQRRFGDPTAGTLLRRRTDELVDLDNEIAAIEYALEEHASATAIAALGTVRCLGCGTLVGPVDRYCSHCGTPRPTEAATSDARTDQGS